MSISFPVFSPSAVNATLLQTCTTSSYTTVTVPTALSGDPASYPTHVRVYNTDSTNDARLAFRKTGGATPVTPTNSTLGAMRIKAGSVEVFQLEGNEILVASVASTPALEITFGRGA